MWAPWGHPATQGSARFGHSIASSPLGFGQRGWSWGAEMMLVMAGEPLGDPEVVISVN